MTKWRSFGAVIKVASAEEIEKYGVPPSFMSRRFLSAKVIVTCFALVALGPLFFYLAQEMEELRPEAVRPPEIGSPPQSMSKPPSMALPPSVSPPASIEAQTTVERWLNAFDSGDVQEIYYALSSNLRSRFTPAVIEEIIARRGVLGVFISRQGYNVEGGRQVVRFRYMSEYSLGLADEYVELTFTEGRWVISDYSYSSHQFSPK